MKQFLLCILSTMCIANASPEIVTQAGMTIALGVNGTGGETEVNVGVKAEPGVNVEQFRFGLDAELNIGFIYTQNLSKSDIYDYDETNAVPNLHIKLGAAGYYTISNTAKLLVEPYITIPLTYSVELCKLSDEQFVHTTQMGYGIKGGAQFATYYQFTVSFERSWFKPYYRDVSKIQLAFNILWQSTSETKNDAITYTPTRAVYSADTALYSSTYTPTYTPSYTDTTSYYNTPTYSGGYTYVRGHYRHYKSGKVSYVRGHYRRK